MSELKLVAELKAGDRLVDEWLFAPIGGPEIKAVGLVSEKLEEILGERLPARRIVGERGHINLPAMQRVAVVA